MDILSGFSRSGEGVSSAIEKLDPEPFEWPARRALNAGRAG
jgi:hypothetical protein